MKRLVHALSRLSPLAKAIAPAAVALAGALITSLLNGQIDATSIGIAVSGLVSAIAVYLTPNRSSTS